MGTKLFRLYQAADDFVEYLDRMERVISREEVMKRIHLINEAYVSWADEVDTAEVLKVD